MEYNKILIKWSHLSILFYFIYFILLPYLTRSMQFIFLCLDLSFPLNHVFLCHAKNDKFLFFYG